MRTVKLTKRIRITKANQEKTKIIRTKRTKLIRTKRTTIIQTNHSKTRTPTKIKVIRLKTKTQKFNRIRLRNRRGSIKVCIKQSECTRWWGQPSEGIGPTGFVMKSARKAWKLKRKRVGTGMNYSTKRVIIHTIRLNSTKSNWILRTI